MTKKAYSTPSIFGGVNHYNKDGKKIGYSSPSLLGGMKHYDEREKKIESSYRGILGEMNHYDADGDKVGYSYPGLFGSTKHYDEDGDKVGVSYQGILAGVNHYEVDGENGSYYGDEFELYTGTDAYVPVMPQEDATYYPPSPESIAREVEAAKRRLFPARKRLLEEQRAIDRYLYAFRQVMPYKKAILRYDWKDNQFIMKKMELVLEDADSHYLSKDGRRFLEGLPYRMTAYNQYFATDEAANLIIDELFSVIYDVTLSHENLLVLTDACRFYLYEMEHLVKNNLREIQFLIYYLEGELSILEGDWVRAVTCYHQILGWEPLLRSMELMQYDWPCDEPNLVFGAEDFYEAVFINLVNTYALLDLPECADYMRKLFRSIYSWVHGVYTRCSAMSEVEKLDALNVCKGFNRYYHDYKEILEEISEKMSLKGAKRARLFRQTVAEYDGISEIYMRYLKVYIMPDYCDWDKEKCSLWMNGFSMKYDPVDWSRQRELLRETFVSAIGIGEK